MRTVDNRDGCKISLEEKVASLPTEAGCYLYKDKKGDVIYVGKAKNLRNRVKQYFRANQDPKTAELVARTVDLEYIITDTELEALILESNLIKLHKPKYNVLLKDDKQYPYLKLTLEDYPRVVKTRRVIDDGSYYSGPYLPASLADSTLKIINRYFQLRSCDIEIDGKRERPCLEYHIKRCLAPCVSGLCTKEQYKESVRDVKLFLEGKTKDLICSLEERMQRAAEELKFELAAKYRDQIRVVQSIGEQQKMLLTAGKDMDIFGYYKEGSCLALQLFTMREGKVVGRREFFWEDIAEPFEPGSFIGAAIKQYYALGNYVPEQVCTPVDFDDRPLLEEYLSKRRGRRVYIIDPKRGTKRDLIELVEKNARYAFEQRFIKSEPDMQLQQLQELLELPCLPQRIECFDISNIQGVENVASLVVCERGRMKRSEYRRFKIRSVEGVADDFASIYEVVYRRYSRLLAEQAKLPDLVLVDGGKGQLAAAVRALSELDLETLPVAAIAKREEEIFLRGSSQGLRLERSLPALKLIQMIRDEAHRYALSYHRKRRKMRDFDCELMKIPGIGKKLGERLLRSFGSIRRVASASESELAPFVGRSRAERIMKYFAERRENS